MPNPSRPSRQAMQRLHHLARHPLHPIAALCAAAMLLPGCGGGGIDQAPVAISGVVADGPLQGATVCYDLNDSGACDSGEPSAVTDADGKYGFEVAAAAAGRHAVLAQVPANAIDKDTGAAVGVALLLKSPPNGNPSDQAVFVSPLSTVVADIASASGKSMVEAAAQVRAELGLSAWPLTDFTTPGAPADLALAARALGRVMVQTAKLAADAGVVAAPAARLVRDATILQLPVLAAALANTDSGATAAARAAVAAAAVAGAMNLSAATVAAVAEQLSKPAGPVDARGPFISVRRFSYTDANNHSALLFIGDSSQQAADGSFVAHEARPNVVAGKALPYSRNQMYWTGSDWQVCDNHWQVITGVQLATAARPQTSAYCGGNRTESRSTAEDIAGQTLRAVITRMRAFPLRDSVGSTTDATGLPVKWGPAPDLLPADAVFPAGAQLSKRSTIGDLGNTDRIELANKSSVRWADGVYRQATTLEQHSGMPGNLADASVTPGTANTVFVADLPLDTQPDATLENFKRWRAGFDMAALKLRFYQCDVKKSDQSQPNCAAAGDGTLAISTQGGVRLLKVASGYPAVLTERLAQQRFWAEHAGTVMRGSTDLQRTRHDQRLNMAAWDALRAALGIPAHVVPTAPVTSGPFETLRNFSFTDAANYSWRSFSGDSSVVDADGNFVANESRKTVSAGADVPFVRNRSYWTGTEWHDCPDSGAVNMVKAAPPNRSVYCKGDVDERVLQRTLSLGGRLMRDVVNDIRAYGSADGGFTYGSWGPSPGAHPQLATTTFPAGATMEYRGNQAIATPLAINTSFQFAPITTLEALVAAYPGGLLGGQPPNSPTVRVQSFTEKPADPAYTDIVTIRVEFDANGNKARFTRSNRLVRGGQLSNFSTLLDTTYSIETVGGVRMLKFAAMPPGFEDQFHMQPMFAERNGSVYSAFKDSVATTPTWSIRLNGSASTALRTALGIQ